MSAHTRCDGCGAELTKLPVNHAKGHRGLIIHGERADGRSGGHQLPNGEFDWCEDCARAAFSAVAARCSVQSLGNAIGALTAKR